MKSEYRGKGCVSAISIRNWLQVARGKDVGVTLGEPVLVVDSDGDTGNGKVEQHGNN